MSLSPSPPVTNMPNEDRDPSKLGDANTRASFVYDLNHEYGLRWANSMHLRTGSLGSKLRMLYRSQFDGMRGHSGGKKKYVKKHNWTRKVPEQRIGCSCTLIVKSYPGTNELLGRYTQAHSHPMGNSNARFVPLPSETRKEIARRLREGVDPAKVLEQIRGGVTSNVFANVADHKFHRNAFCTAADVRRIQKSIEAEMVRLAKQDGPSVVAVVEYLAKYWMSDDMVKMWSATNRTTRDVFQDCDTNMLLEAWHHVLKGMLMQGKRNQLAEQHFIARHQRQEFGFEGPDLEVQKTIEMVKLGSKISSSDIFPSDDTDGNFLVKSQSKSDQFYAVQYDVDGFTCECPAYVSILFCKHIAAVQHHFSEAYMVVSASRLDIHAKETFQSESVAATERSALPDVEGPTPDIEQDINVVNEIWSINRKMNLVTEMLADPGSKVALEALQTFNMQLTGLLGGIEGPSSWNILPNQKKVAPNQGNDWDTTKALMGSSVKKRTATSPTEPPGVVKSKRKGLHDREEHPYGGKERSGKKAKPDALQKPLECSQHEPQHDSEPLEHQSLQVAPASLPLSPEPATPVTIAPQVEHPALYNHLYSLKRGELNALGREFNIGPLKGTNEAIIERLMAQNILVLCGRFGL
ncbi:hypothetical protein BKA70DRAFT_1225782 [Coprinopsis sp. MPI-PUGE-AT-0042]|nr:hypothetical protein BKA70DRAFT_1225782 [Coprinopsis sp. MPI-PUGE-AT-0042]